MDMKKELFRKIISGLMLCLLLVNTAYSPSYGDGNSSLPGVVNVTNSFVKYNVNTGNGRFSIKTDEGVPYKNDDNSNLTFEEGKPETSFTTFRINGEDYIYGNSYGFMDMDGTFIEAPTAVDKTTTSTWVVGEIHIRQILELLEDEENPNVGNVRIKYEVTNKGDTAAEIGTRILIDTMLGSNDGAPITLGSSDEALTHEAEITAEDIPQYWRSTDNLFAPRIISYGFNSGWGNISPSKMIIAHWSNISETKWDYQTDSSMDFTSPTNKYKTRDSAVALYWKPISIEPNSKQVFETFYGIGNFQSYYEGAKFNLTLNAPEKLALNSTKTGYQDDTFEIIAEVDNTLSEAEPLTNVTASLILEEGLEVISSEIPYKETRLIDRNEIQTFKWTVRVDKQSQYTAKQFRVDISCNNNTEPISQTGYILLPGTNGQPPSIQFQSVSPDKLYYQGAKSLTIKGKGYDVYKYKDKWRMYFVNEATEEAIPISRDSIIVDSDSIRVNFEGDFSKGKYFIRITHEDFELENVPHEIEMTDDERYKCRSYGILYIKKQKQDNEWSYSIEAADNIDELNDLKEGYKNNENIDIILDIKGEIREYNIDGQSVYKVMTDSESAVFNSVFHYKGTPLEICKPDDIIQMVGDGKLTVENGFSFWWWKFEINIADGENYIKEFSEEESSGESNIEIEFTGIGTVMKTIAGFCIEINNALILEDGISFGGNMELSFMPKEVESKPSISEMTEMDEDEVDGTDLRRLFGEEDDDEDEVDGDDLRRLFEEDDDDDEEEEEEKEASLTVDISKVLYGQQGINKEVGFIGIDTEIAFEATEDTIPVPIISDGFEATLTINTLEDIYGLEGEVDIKICEAYVNLTFMKNPKTGNYVPDDLVLSAGFDPGFAIGATGFFVTKIGGGVEDLFGTITGDNSLPPLQVVLIGGLSFAKVVDLEVTIKASKEGFSLDGEGEIARIKCLESVHIVFRWAQPMSFELSAELSLFKIVEGELSISIDAEHWEGIISADIKIPEDIRFVGGIGFGAELGANNDKIWGSIEVIGIPVGVTYYWGGGVDFDLWASLDESIPYASRGLGTSEFADKEGNNVTMVVGSNIKKIGSSKQVIASTNPNLSDMLVLASEDKREHLFNIYNQDIALIELEFTGSSPNLTVYMPDGTQYALKENENMIIQQIAPNVSKSGELEQYVFISINNPQNGQWKVKSSVEVESILMDVEIVPQLNSVNANKLDDNKLEVTWDVTNPSESKASIMLASNTQESGTLLIGDIDAQLGKVVLDVPVGIESGDYYIRVAVQKEGFGYDSMYSNSTINIIDPYQPASVENVEASSYGDGMLQVKWKDIEDTNIEGYYLSVYDEQGNIAEGIGHQFVPYGSPQAVVGGAYKLSNINETVSLETGRNYKLGIVTSKKIGDETSYSYHYSEMAYSKLVYLPEPNPAKISILFDNSFIDGLNDEGKSTKISNQDKVTLYFNSDQADVMTEVYINNVLFKRKSGSSFGVTFPASDGNYDVEFRTTNGSGDVTTKTVSYTIDRTAPILLVDSPVQGQVGQGGYITVKGVTEKDAGITVNGKHESIDANGSFEASIKLQNQMNQTVVIETIDKANNVTTYSTEVVNDTIRPLKQVYIRPQAVEINAYDPITFELIGVDERGQEVVLDNSNVQWSLLMGENLATVSDDGMVKGYSIGSIVLKASYSIADDYSFEDAITIEILEPIDGWNQVEEELINSELEAILGRILMNEQGLSQIGTYDIYPTRLNSLSINNELEIIIPENSVLQRDELLAARVENTSEYIDFNNHGMRLIGEIYELQFAKTNNNLNGNVELIFRFDPSMVKDINRLGIYYYNETTNSWQFIGGVLELLNNTVSAEVSHFSKYALFEGDRNIIFEDIAGIWSEEYILHLAYLKVINGVELNGKHYYQPTREITRMEFTKLVIATLSNLKTLDNDPNANTAPLADWNDIPEWGKEYVALGYENGIILGIDSDKGKVFEPSRYITREEAVTIIGRTFDSDVLQVSQFSDKDQMSALALEQIDKLVQEDIISGYPDNSFRPKGNLTREEAAKIIYTWIENVLNDR